MNSEDKNKKNRKPLAYLLAVLAVLALISAVIAASRISGLTKEEKRNYIPIGDDTSSDQPASDSDVKHLTGEMIVKDLEIFRVSYSNKTGEITVKSSNGDKLIAPGTDWKYSFTLRNTKEVSINYRMRVQAFVEGTDLALPVKARMRGPKGWMTGKKSSAYVPVLDLDGLRDSGVLARDHIADYRLSWKWPFESGGEEADAFDTMLGDMAVEDDIVLTIRLSIYAWDDEEPDKPGGRPVPPTGDNFSAGIWIAAMIISFFAFILVLADSRRRKSEQN